MFSSSAFDRLTRSFLDHCSSYNLGLANHWESIAKVHEYLMLWTEQTAVSGTVDKASYLKLASKDNARYTDQTMNTFLLLASWHLLSDDIKSGNITNLINTFNRKVLLEFELTHLADKLTALSSKQLVSDALTKERHCRAKNWVKLYPKLKGWFDVLFAPATTQVIVTLTPTSEWMEDLDYLDYSFYDEE